MNGPFLGPNVKTKKKVNILFSYKKRKSSLPSSSPICYSRLFISGEFLSSPFRLFYRPVALWFRGIENSAFGCFFVKFSPKTLTLGLEKFGEKRRRWVAHQEQRRLRRRRNLKLRAVLKRRRNANPSFKKNVILIFFFFLNILYATV